MSAIKDQIGVWREALDEIGVTYEIQTGAYDDWSIHAGLPYTKTEEEGDTA
jgi:hypothetical protein